MMTRCLQLILFLGCAVGAVQAGETILGDSRIGSVTVMADRAEVTRAVSATVPKGESIVVVEGLLVELDERTLRVESPQGVTVQGISSDVVKRKIMPPADKATLVKRVNDLHARIDAIEASVLGLRRQVELARSYRARTLDAIGLQALLPAEKLPQGKLDLESWGRALEALSDQELQALNKTRDLEVERFGLQQEAQEVKVQLQQHDAPRVQEVRRALVGLSSPQGGAVTFQLIYRVPGPTWRVSYDLRFEDRKSVV